MIGQWRKIQDSAQIQVNHLKNILEQTMTGMNFIEDMAADKLEELKDPLAWRK